MKKINSIGGGGFGSIVEGKICKTYKLYGGFLLLLSLFQPRQIIIKVTGVAQSGKMCIILVGFGLANYADADDE